MSEWVECIYGWYGMKATRVGIHYLSNRTVKNIILAETLGLRSWTRAHLRLVWYEGFHSLYQNCGASQCLWQVLDTKDEAVFSEMRTNVEILSHHLRYSALQDRLNHVKTRKKEWRNHSSSIQSRNTLLDASYPFNH